MDFAERLQQLAKDAQARVTELVDQAKDKYQDSDLDDKVAAFKADVAEKYTEFAGSVKGKLDETDLDERFTGFTQALGDKYRDVAGTVKDKYDDSDLDDKFEGLRADFGEKFADFKAAFLPPAGASTVAGETVEDLAEAAEDVAGGTAEGFVAPEDVDGAGQSQ